MAARYAYASGIAATAWEWCVVRAHQAGQPARRSQERAPSPASPPASPLPEGAVAGSGGRRQQEALVLAGFDWADR
eukprot:15468199-Alexandrium_andersonii.AAC.1